MNNDNKMNGKLQKQLIIKKICAIIWTNILKIYEEDLSWQKTDISVLIP